MLGLLALAAGPCARPCSALQGEQHILPCAVLQEPGLLQSAAWKSFAAHSVCSELGVPFLMAGFVQARLEPLDATAIIQVINNGANEFHYARLAAQSAPGQPGPTSLCLQSGSPARRWQVPVPKSASIYIKTSEEGLEAVREAGNPPSLNPSPRALRFPCSHPGSRPLLPGRMFLAGSSSLTHGEPSLARGEKCHSHRRVVPRTPLGHRTLCSNSKGCLFVWLTCF